MQLRLRERVVHVVGQIEVVQDRVKSIRVRVLQVFSIDSLHLLCIQLRQFEINVLLQEHIKAIENISE